MENNTNRNTSPFHFKKVGSYGIEEYIFRESKKLLFQGRNRKAFLILDKLLLKFKTEKTLNEEIAMKIGKFYMRAGLRILRQYEQRGELSIKEKTIVIMNKLMDMVILWYSAIVKLLDVEHKIEESDSSEEENNEENEENDSSNSQQEISFIKSINFVQEKTQAQSNKTFNFQTESIQFLTIDRLESNMNASIYIQQQNSNSKYQDSPYNKKISSFCVFLDSINNSNTINNSVTPNNYSVSHLSSSQQPELQFKCMELQIEILMINLINPRMQYQIQKQVNIKDNITEYWVNFIEFINIWSAYYKQQDIKKCIKLMTFAEGFLAIQEFKNTTSMRLLDIAWRTVMQKAVIFLEMRMFQEASNEYEESIEWKQKELLLRMKKKTSKNLTATKQTIDKLDKKVQKTVSEMCVSLLGLQLCYEQQERIEKANETFHLLQWLGSCFIEHSELMEEITRSQSLFSECFKDLIMMNSEISQVIHFAIGKINPKQNDITSGDDESPSFTDHNFLNKIDTYLYNKSKAKELNKSQIIIEKKKENTFLIASIEPPPIKTITFSSRKLTKPDIIEDTSRLEKNVYYSSRNIIRKSSQELNHSGIKSAMKNSFLNKQDSTQKVEESIISQNAYGLNTTTASSKKELNKTGNTSGVEIQLQLNGENISILENSKNAKLNQPLQINVGKYYYSTHSDQRSSSANNKNKNNNRTNTFYELSKKLPSQSSNKFAPNEFSRSVISTARSNFQSTTQLNQNSEFHSSSSFNGSNGTYLNQNGTNPGSQRSLSRGEKMSFIKEATTLRQYPSIQSKMWPKQHIDKKKLSQHKKANDANDANLNEKYQPSLISSRKYFLDKDLSHNTDATFLNDSQKELDIKEIFSVNKNKTQQNFLEHDVNTFADNLIAREILQTSNCFTYPSLQQATEQNINDSLAEKSEFKFCRKILRLKKNNRVLEMKEDDELDLANFEGKFKKEADEVYETITSKQKIEQNKKQIEEAKRIQNLNLHIQVPSSPKEEPKNQFRKIMLKNSNKLGLKEIKASLKKLAFMSKNFKPKQSLKQKTDNEEEKFKKIQEMNRKTIQQHLYDVENQISYANSKTIQVKSDFDADTSPNDSKSIQQQSLTIGEKMCLNYTNLSNSTKHYFTSYPSSKKLNTVSDIIIAKIKEQQHQQKKFSLISEDIKFKEQQNQLKVSSIVFEEKEENCSPRSKSLKKIQ